MQTNPEPELRYPIADAPDPGRLIEIRPGILWSRLPLPYAPFHINTYLIEDRDGWVAIEAGLNDDATHHAWNLILSGRLQGARLTRVLATHWHSDHLGSAGWLCDRFDASLLMSESEYLTGLVMQIESREVSKELQRSFFLSHGLDAETTEAWVANGHQYLHMMAPIPKVYHRLVAGDRFEIGKRRFDIHTVAGHSPEEVLLYGAADNLFFSADQVTPKIAPNLAVQANDPDGNPLGLYMAALDYIDRTIPPDALVLPAHELPYERLPVRTKRLRRYYNDRCEIAFEACKQAPRTAVELIDLLSRRRPDGTWIGFVISEIVTYLNYMVSLNRLALQREGNVIRYAAPWTRGREGA
jgi:glyoxylase-like metal-dependent hydrolase (beta-lactamase superfamily II)